MWTEGCPFILADIPGIIEISEVSRPEFHDFLRHVDRCRLLIPWWMVSGQRGPLIRWPTSGSHQNPKLRVLPRLASRRMIVAGNKVDIAADRTGLEGPSRPMEGWACPSLGISAAAHQGTQELMFRRS